MTFRGLQTAARNPACKVQEFIISGLIPFVAIAGFFHASYS